MTNLLEKTLLTALGAATLSQKKAEEFLQDLKQKFNISEEEGKALLSKLQETARENQEKLEQRAHDEMKKACERLGVVTRDEFDKLKKKVSQLEKRLKEQDA